MCMATNAIPISIQTQFADSHSTMSSFQLLPTPRGDTRPESGATVNIRGMPQWIVLAPVELISRSRPVARPIRTSTAFTENSSETSNIALKRHSAITSQIVLPSVLLCSLSTKR
jgi:hypothetical protein